jgi:hypothetical protein
MSGPAVAQAKDLHYRYPDLKYPVNMDVIVAAEGCELIEWPFLSPVKEVKAGRWIGIAKGISSEERRYLIAHALGHELLHRGNQLSFHGWRKTNVAQQEREADEFAAHVLIPASQLEKCEDLQTWEIAERYGVPEELVRLRISDFATEKERGPWNNW